MKIIEEEEEEVEEEDGGVEQDVFLSLQNDFH
jgi:hypothetical protein